MGRGVVAQGGLLDHPALVEDCRLPLDFRRQRFLDEPERVEVLELGPNSELQRAPPAQREVRVAAKIPLLQVGVRDLEVAQD